MTIRDPRIRLVPHNTGIMRAWRVTCLDCGFLTMPLVARRAEMIRRVHRHRHIMGYIGNTYELRTPT